MLDNVIEAMVDAVLVVDVEGRVTLANTAAARLTGYTHEELQAIAVAKLLIDDRSGLRTVVRRRIEDGGVLRHEESWLITRAGDRIPVSVTGSAVLAATGELEGIVLVARDVREVRQLLRDRDDEIARRRTAEEELLAAKASIEEQLEQSRTQLLLAERRATLGTLAGGVGHELRNIAQVLVIATEMIRAALDAGDNIHEVAAHHLRDLERVGDHIAQHGQRLMRLARPGPDHVEPTEVDAIVQDSVAMLRSAGRLRRISVSSAVGPEGLRVTVNRARIEQILLNLMFNACDAIGENIGTITVQVRPSADGTRVICKVSDTGGGIAAAQLETIFEPFFTTKDSDKGTGLGLPVAREIVESYGGTLTCVSEVGVGTAFTFDLPR